MSANVSNKDKIESVSWLERGLKQARGQYYSIEKSAFVVLAISFALLSYLVYGFADYLVRFPRIVRVLLDVGLVVGLIIFMKRFSWKQIKNLEDVENVARLVETIKEKEGDSQRSLLICALQFGLHPDIPGSLELKNETIKLAKSNCVNPAKVAIHDKKHVKHATRAAIGVALLYAAWVLLFFPHMRIFLMRSIVLNARYPTATKILDVKYAKAAPMREDYTIEVTADGRLPSSGRLKVAYDGGKAFNVTLEQDEAEEGLYRAMIPSPLDSFTFEGRVGDCETGKYAVRIMVPAFVEVGEVEITPPKYTGMGSFRTVLKNLSAPERSKIVFRVTPSRPVAECALLFGGQELKSMRKKGESYELHMLATNGMSYAVKLVDNDGLENRDRVSYYMNITPDAPPIVDLVSPEPGSFFSSVSRLLFKVEIKDDYGIKKVELAYRVLRAAVDGGEDDEGSEKVVNEQTIPLDATGNETKMKAQLRKLVNEFNCKAGDRIAFVARANDYFPGDKRVGESDEISVMVVTADKLRAMISKDRQRVGDLLVELTEEEKRHAKALRERLRSL